MKYKVLFTASLVRRLAIYSNYRPDWTSDSKPEYNCGMLTFENKYRIEPGEQHQCTLQPLEPKLWPKVAVNDILRCMEGSRQVGEAVVLEIMP